MPTDKPSRPSNKEQDAQATADGRSSNKRRKKSRRSRSKNMSANTKPTYTGAEQQLVENFIVCGRCSFFLSGYRALVGSEKLAEVQEASQAGWLSLAWDDALQQLVERSYGIRVFADVVHLNGQCKQCGRQYVYTLLPDDDAPEEGADDAYDEDGTDDDEVPAEIVEQPVFAIQFLNRPKRRTSRRSA